MNFSKQLYQTIQNTIHTFDIIDTFDRESVFADLVKFCRDISSQEDTFKMYFVFNKYKKILLFLREENFVLAEYNLEYLINKNINYSNEEDYQKSVIENKDWFLIYYGGKRYSYDRHSKILKDKSGNKIRASEQDDVFNQQMNQIIHNTVNPTKSIDVF